MAIFNSYVTNYQRVCSMIFPFDMGAFQYVMSVGSSKRHEIITASWWTLEPLKESLLGTTDVEQAIHLLQILSLTELWALYTCFLQSLHKFRLRHAGVNTSTLTVIDVLGCSPTIFWSVVEYSWLTLLFNILNFFVDIRARFFSSIYG